MLPEFMNLLRKFYFMRAAARNSKRQSDFFGRLKRAVNLHVIHGSFFVFIRTRQTIFYYCYGGTLHNSDALSTDDPALYHNYSVYIFLTPFDPYCYLHSPVYIYRIILSVSPATFSRSPPIQYSKRCFLPIDKNIDLQYTLN